MKSFMIALAVLSLCLTGGMFVAPQAALATAITNECIEPGDKGKKDRNEVGPFLQDICDECYDQGDCALRDIEIVFANFGNFTLEIVGALVLLMYVIGGIFLLVSHGDDKLVAKGKQFIQISTLGLIVVLFGYVAVSTLKSALLSGGTQVYVTVCDETTEGQDCGLASKCKNNLCLTECNIAGGECLYPEQDHTDYNALERACPGEQTCWQLIEAQLTGEAEVAPEVYETWDGTNVGAPCAFGMYFEADGTCTLPGS